MRISQEKKDDAYLVDINLDKQDICDILEGYLWADDIILGGKRVNIGICLEEDLIPHHNDIEKI